MTTQWTRRQFLAALTAAGLLFRMPALRAATGKKAITRGIPSSGEPIPVIGMGAWRTFNVGGDQHLVSERTEVLKTFFDLGGTLVDSSPMYGSADDVMGEALATLNTHDRVFSANKIWTRDGSDTREQDRASRRKWGIERFDLQQVHNLLAWEAHLHTLKQMKADVRINQDFWPWQGIAVVMMALMSGCLVRGDTLAKRGFCCCLPGPGGGAVPGS